MIEKRILPILLLMGSAWGAAVPAMAQGPEIKLDITARCQDGDAQFEIINAGEAWPGMAMVSLIRTDTKAVVTQREMRMRPGQRIVYRAKDAPDGVEIGLRVEPDWYKRPPAMDTIITCLTPPASSEPEATPPSTTPR